MSYNPFDDFEIDPFGFLLANEKRSDIFITPTHGTSSLRHDISSSHDGGVRYNLEEFEVATSDNPNCTTYLKTRTRMSYTPGFQAEAGLGIRINQLPTGAQTIEWGGILDENDGFGFGQDSTGSYIFVRRSGAFDEKIRQGSWNINNLGGTATSSGSTDLGRGVITKMKWTWYGYGTIQFGFMVADDDSSRKEYVPVHNFNSHIEGPTLKTPQMPLGIQVSNNGVATPLTASTCGIGSSLVGEFKKKRRTISTSVLTASIGTTDTSVLAVRRKVDIERNEKSINIVVQKIQMLSNSNLVVRGVRSPNLSGGTWFSPPGVDPIETIVEVSTGSAITNGSAMFTDLIAAGSSRGVETFASTDSDIEEFEILPQESFGIVARSLTGSPAEASFVISWIEDW